MTEEVLSQAEVESLLSAMGAGAGPAAVDPQPCLLYTSDAADVYSV